MFVFQIRPDNPEKSHIVLISNILVDLWFLRRLFLYHLFLFTGIICKEISLPQFFPICIWGFKEVAWIVVPLWPALDRLNPSTIMEARHWHYVYHVSWNRAKEQAFSESWVDFPAAFLFQCFIIHLTCNSQEWRENKNGDLSTVAL